MIRHGESMANLQGLVTGGEESPLTDKGKEQCRSLRTLIQIRGLEFDRYVVSPMLRAVQSAEIIFPDQKFVVLPEIAETDAGHCAEWPLVRFLADHSNFYSEFDPDRPYPGGESHMDLYHRTTHWFMNAIETYGEHERVVMVAHNGPIACVLHHCYNTPMTCFPRFTAPNASLSHLHIDKTGVARLYAFGIAGGI
ncbi:histidine phosphatase family protein [Oceanidesulfovibrio marinus]|nr:histidine phosphatase family protein [Oceanidesulfovibrio marinus]